MTHPSVAVIGGGPTGLAAAAYLARRGAHVTVFERSGSLGGRAATQNRNGYLFNRGAHALYTGGPASAVLQDLGVTYQYAVPKQTSTLHDGVIHPLTTSPASLLTSKLLHLGDKLALIRFFAAVPRTDAARLSRVSAADWLAHMAPRPRVHQMVEGVARTVAYSAALDYVSADLVVSRLQNALKHPVHYVVGGWQTLVDGLERAATRAGATVVRNTSVVAIEGDAVTLRDGTRQPVDSVIVATTPREAMKLLPGLSVSLEDALPAEVACLDVALHSLPRPDWSVVQDIDAPRFLTAQSRYVNIAPNDGGLVHLFKQLDPRLATDAHADERELEDLLDIAQPGWRELEVDRVFLPRMQGAGILPSVHLGGLAGRPQPTAAGLPNVFLAGDWVGPDGYLLDTALASARVAAELAIDREAAQLAA